MRIQFAACIESQWSLFTHWSYFAPLQSLPPLSVAYRLSPWHPLARYPGPLLCSITKFYFAFLALTGRQHIYYRRLHQKYGNIIRIGPNEVSICDANAIVGLLGNGGLPKGSFWDGRIPPGEVPLIAIKDKKEHGRRRRPWNRAFSPIALKGYEDIVTRRVVQLCDELANRVGQSIDLSTGFSYFSFDVMNDLAFGGGSDMIRLGDINGFWHLLEASQKNATFLSHVPWLGQLVYRLPFLAGKLKAFRAYARDRAFVRSKDGSSSKDIYHYLTGEDGVTSRPPSMKEIISDGSLAIVAGSDTVASAVAHTFYYLMANQSKLEHLQQEIDTLGDDILDPAKQAQLPYLNAILCESMRLLPPVLTGSRRTTPRQNDGQMVGQYYIPSGTTAYMATYALQRDPRYFAPHPNDFLPERWLPEDVRRSLAPNVFKDDINFILDQTAFIPFSFGPANCVGSNLAWMELRMLVVMLVYKFDFAFDPLYDRDRWCKEVQDFFITVKGELPTIPKLRKRGERV
ncbi:cytochrome P450 [Panaeolus papilionaceus]|nr:cytochrome P450 [Panaeolus papilionaceus]